MADDMDDDQIDALLKNADVIPILAVVSSCLCEGGFTMLMLFGTNTPWLLCMVTLFMAVPVWGHVSILRILWLLRGRGYFWIGWWQAAILNKLVGPSLPKLPPADEFLALPGAERDVRSIVRVLLSR